MHKKIKQQAAGYRKYYWTKNNDCYVEATEFVKVGGAAVDYYENGVHNSSDDPGEQPGENASWQIGLRIIVIHKQGFKYVKKFTKPAEVF